MHALVLSLLIPVFCSFAAFAQKDDGRTITIPVVFHVLYVDDLPDNGMSDAVKKGNNGNSTTHLPKEKIVAELEELDRDFQGLNLGVNEIITEYKPVIGNAKIHFTLKDILYIKVDRNAIDLRSNAPKFHEISPLQDENRCLNVYISVLKVGGKGSEGVTIVPETSLPTGHDAVNLNYSWVGLGYHLLSHEVGHWLGLWHVDDENQIDISHVTDIPVQTELTHIGCEICTRRGVKVIRKQRKQFSNPNTNNFMDYSGCRSMFSIQQCNYMRDLVIRLRPEMWNNQ